MRRISSSLTPLYRWLAPCLGVSGILFSLLILRRGVFPAVLFAASGVSVLVIWWLYLRIAQQVYVDQNAIHLREPRRAQVAVPYECITSIRAINGIKFPPVEIIYKAENGEPSKAIFLPSHRHYWS